MTVREVHIREASSDDIPVLPCLIRNAYADVARRFDLTPENCPRHPSNCKEEWIENDFSRGVIYYILQHKGSPVGCVAFEKASPDLCYLERLSVLPPYRRQGFGRALVDHVFSQARAFGAKQISIGIISEQTDLKQWYQKIGFVEEETKKFDHLPFLVAFMTYDL